LLDPQNRALHLQLRPAGARQVGGVGRREQSARAEAPAGDAPGDEALIYHTGDEKAVVGLARVTSAAYPDPKAKDPKLVVVELKPIKRLKGPVTLAAIKAEPAFQDLALVRMPRLSVVPATAAHWKKLLAMAGNG